MLKLKFFFILFFVTTAVFAQQKKMTRAEYDKEFTRLDSKKRALLAEKAQLKSSIEKLNQKLLHLDSLYKACRPALLIKKYGRKIGNRIALGKVWKGMTERMLKDSWGKPDRITTNRQKWGVFRQYYYGNIIYFFRDGKLIDWEDGSKHK